MIWTSILSKSEIQLFRKLNTPKKIQDHLNALPFNFSDEPIVSSPRMILKNKKAHCLEGALLGAAVLLYHNYKVWLLDLKTARSRKDFDHVVAVFMKDGCYGALSKTNHNVLRYREPIYKTVRELVLSYFHEYFLDDGTKTLRSYSALFDVRKMKSDWIASQDDIWHIGALLDELPHKNILTKSQIKQLRKADKVEIEAGKITEWKRDGARDKV